MAILINDETKVIVQGITGKEGSKATKQMLDYGTKVICGVTPGKAGELVQGLPVYNSIEEAKKIHPKINSSVIYVPPLRAKDAALEAFNSGIKLVVCITEQIPIKDVLIIRETALKIGAIFIGPSSIGIISPGVGKLGSIGGEKNIQFKIGDVGIISKSGGMCSESALLLKNNGVGVSTAVGIGGDTICGSDFVDLIKFFEVDSETKVIFLYGEIGGEYENLVGNYIKENGMKKPIVAFVSGIFAQAHKGVTLGHAGAILEGENSSREKKLKVLKEAGVEVAQFHHEIVNLIKKYL